MLYVGDPIAETTGRSFSVDVWKSILLSLLRIFSEVLERY